MFTLYQTRTQKYINYTYVGNISPWWRTCTDKRNVIKQTWVVWTKHSGNYLAATFAIGVLPITRRDKGQTTHNDVIKWKQFPRHSPFIGRIHRSPVDSPHKGQWRGANVWTNIWDAGELRRHRTHHDATVMTDIAHSFHHIRVLNGYWHKPRADTAVVFTEQQNIASLS